MEPNKTKKEGAPEGDPGTVVPENGKEKFEERIEKEEKRSPDENTDKEPYVDFSKLF